MLQFNLNLNRLRTKIDRSNMRQITQRKAGYIPTQIFLLKVFSNLWERKKDNAFKCQI